MRVLLIEDDDAVRDLVADMLIEEGFEVDGLAFAEDALVLLGSGEQIDLLVTDVDLGEGLTGIDLAAIARSRYPDVELIFISGDAVDRKGRAPAAHEHLIRKPFRRAELMAVIGKVKRSS